MTYLYSVRVELFFQNPALLWLVAALLIQALLLGWYWRWRQRTLRQLGSPVLVRRLLRGFSPRRFWLKNLLFATALALLAIAIADPRHRAPAEVKQGRGADIVLAFDVSASMWAAEVSPNRLEQARTFAQRLVTALEGNRIGVVFFAGDAFAQLPLSTDYAAVRALLQQAEPAFIAQAGTDLGAAIEASTRLFESSSSAGRAVVLISDGEDHEGQGIRQAQAAQQAGVRLFTVGVGKTEGATVLLPGGQPLRDAGGATAYSRPDFAQLHQIAQAGGGHFWEASESGAVQRLSEACDRLQKDAVALKAPPQYTYYFVWPTLIAWCLLLLEQLIGWRLHPAEL